MASTAPLARMDRRLAIKWMLSAAASTALFDRAAVAADTIKFAPASGYGTDPNLLKDYKPGDLWPLTLTDAQRRTVAALCDVVIPADEKSPSAPSLGIHDFIDEWISAPYPGQALDKRIVLDGLVWLDAESQRRFQTAFAALTPARQTAICSDICYTPKAAAVFQEAARFFARFRDLTAAGFYTTAEGMKDIGYVGNVPLASFAGPPPEVLHQLGLD